MNFDEWKRSGPDLIRVLRARGEETSFRKLLSELYPKKAHFIYELFQNAEDQSATECKFILSKDQLIFEHNGTQFAESDVIGITGIGNSTKKDDPTKIGKFGVGFKAVFAYTDTPEIYSGNFKFRIKDLLVIDDILVSKNIQSSLKNGSLFRFPFNNPDKNPNDAYLEIKTVLNNLGDNTLLFLSSIKKICYQFDGYEGSLERIENADNVIKIINNRPNLSKYASYWLRFDKVVTIQNEDKKSQKCLISVAFKLDGSEKKGFRIVPLDRGEVSIYFPAESEVSNLFFNINAPFGSTVARDCVRESYSNDLLRNEIAILLLESLDKIKGYNYLNVDFLSVLPNSLDNLSKFYAPIREKLILAFQSDPLTPTSSGHYANSQDLYIGPSEIQHIFADEDLSIITGFDIPLWCQNPSKNSLRALRFLGDLNIDNWGYEEICNFLVWGDKNKVEDWISKKTDEQLFRIYSLIGRSIEEDNLNYSYLSSKIVRSFSKSTNTHESPDLIFFPLDLDDEKKYTDIKFVKDDVYKKYGNKTEQKYAQLFLTEIGVKQYDAKASILKILSKYDEKCSIKIEEHIQDIRKILEFNNDHPYEISSLRYKKFIFCDKNGNNAYESADNIYIDSEYQETHLSEVRNIHKKWPLSTLYAKFLSKEEVSNFIIFLKEIGLFYRLIVEHQYIERFPHPEYDYLTSGSGNESRKTVNRDYLIPNLRRYLRSNSVHISKLIWDACLGADSEVMEASYQRNAQSDLKRCESSLVYLLRESEWVPNIENKLLRPEAVSLETLHPIFIANFANGFLDKIGFGKIEKTKNSEFETYKKIVESRGFSVDTVEQVLNFISKGLNINELRRFISEKESNNPTARVENPSRRKQNILEDTVESPSLKSISVERKIQQGIDEVRAKSRAYLRTLYRNDNNELICQCCLSEMPFRLKSTGEHYFEATQIFKNTSKNLYQFRLALCPNCSAMYEHGCELVDADIIDRINKTIISNDNATHYLVSLLVLDRDQKFYFVEKHLFDIQVLLNR